MYRDDRPLAAGLAYLVYPATAGVAVLISTTALQWVGLVGGGTARLNAGRVPPGWLGLVVVAIVVAAALTQLLPRRVAGWPASAFGCAVVCALLVASGEGGLGGNPPRPSMVVAAAGSGIALGGILTTIAGTRPAGSTPARRLPLGVAFTLGFLFGPALSRATWLGFSHPWLTVIGSVTALAVVTAVLDAFATLPPAAMPSTAGGLAIGLPIMIAAVALGVFLLDELRTGILVHLGSVEWLSVSRMHAMDDVAAYGGLAIALGVGLAMLWYAFCAAGADAARWVLTCLGLGVPFYALFALPASVSSTNAFLAIAALALGALLARYSDRYVPWETLGLLAAAPAIIAMDAVYDVGNDIVNKPHLTGWLVVVGAFTFGNGLTRMAARIGTRFPGAPRDLTVGDVLLGFAVLLLGGTQFAALRVVRRGPASPELPVAGALTIGIAVLGLIIFVVARWMAGREPRRPDAGDVSPTGQFTPVGQLITPDQAVPSAGSPS